MSESVKGMNRHHIFLAYHGDDKTGSQKEAENIYRLIKGLYQDAIDIYFHPISSPNSSYHDTPREVIRSSFFILVAKSNIPLDEEGTIKKVNKRNELSDLYQEVDIFYEKVFKKNPDRNKTFAKVIRVGDLKEEVAEDFYFNMFKSENYSYEEIIKDFENSLFNKNWFSRADFFAELSGGGAPKQAKHIVYNVSNHDIADGMYENDYLLKNGFTVEEISERHVYLDKITVDANKFPDALDEEVEGDADTWKEMISATADCSANLIINNEIVGYMDFLPVEPETYDELKTVPFSEDAVAFYSLGGDFDIFGSMFSIDLNYATPKNYLLFFNWMVQKIINWKEDGIFIHRIVFSIYSNNQAKALERLGFVKILENQLKGMLYEIRVEDLLNNKIVTTKLLQNRESQIVYKKYYDHPKNIIDDCKEIANSHSVENGGLLHFLDAVDDSEIIICAEKKEQVIGYVALKTYEILENSLYVEQIAVKKGFTHQGVGKALLGEVLAHANQHRYEAIVANCNKKNHASYNLFTSMGFIEYKMSEETYLNIGFKQEDINDNLALRHFLSNAK